MSTTFSAHFISSVFALEAREWDALWQNSPLQAPYSGNDYPFFRHSFMAALEKSQSIGGASGWQPQHLLIKKENVLLAIVPLFIKTHSYGEYVFDWSWADAYQRAGLDYYPKLINAVPFTPATGPRLAFLPALEGDEQRALYDFIDESLSKFLQEKSFSSFHSLFPNSASKIPWKQCEYLSRLDCQYHWFNDNYSDFNNFLGAMSSRKRKNILKERKKISDSSLKIVRREGRDISEASWRRFYLLYHTTYLKRSGRYGYLTEEFFSLLGKNLADQLMMVQVFDSDEENEDEFAASELIAAALYFKDGKTLYGRYWGALRDIDALHFEACYYQGIEYAIEKALVRFDPGAQGEHKISRGFVPIHTRSYHKIMHPEFSEAVARFLDEESQYQRQYLLEARGKVPFKDGRTLVPPLSLIE